MVHPGDSDVLTGLAALVAEAAEGSDAAWQALVEKHSGLLWSITRGYRLAPSDAGDAVQTTWLRLLEHIDRLDEPGRVTAWLATTTRRECLRVLALRRRTVLAGDGSELLEQPDGRHEPDEAMVRAEVTGAVRGAMGQLPEHWRALMELLMRDPPPSYEAISCTLGIPIGSIGPTRARCLRRLGQVEEVAALR